MRLLTLSVISSFLFTSTVNAYFPTADENTYNLFIDQSSNAIPKQFFIQSKVNNYLLKNVQSPTVEKLPQWGKSIFANKLLTSWYKPMSYDFPSFTEPSGERGQCVAFAKAATFIHQGKAERSTQNWYASSNVMPQSSGIYYNDHASELYKGKMVAFFGSNGKTDSVYPQGNNKDSNGNPIKPTYGHVGIFLKYAYDKSFPLIPTYPPVAAKMIGFWIADENYEGTGVNTKDGKIRKHLILSNFSKNDATNANKYFFVNVKMNSQDVLTGGTVTDTCSWCNPLIYGNSNGIVDGNMNTARNLGTYSGVFTIKLKKVASLSRLMITPSMLPNGVVQYQISTSIYDNDSKSPNPWKSEPITNSIWKALTPVEFNFSSKLNNIKRVKISIISSPSWVALHEVQGF